MITPAIPANEQERLQALKEYSILDTMPEQDFEDITKIASEICQTPISLITLIDSDRQWFKSSRGIDGTETPREHAFCAHAINKPEETFTVNDSRKDARFSNNPYVTGDPNVVFYTGVPLVNSDGYALGTICVLDHIPRELTAVQLESLRALSNQIVKLMELRKANIQLEEARLEIENRNSELEKFAYVISHDIKSPLRNIISLTGFLKKSLSGKIHTHDEEVIDHLMGASVRLRSLIDSIIDHYMGVHVNVHQKDEINLPHLYKEIIDLLDSRREHEINFNSDMDSITANEVAVKQILINLISNAIKYNDKNLVKIDVTILSKTDFYEFIVEDNGQGIEESQYDKIFEVFATLGTKDRFNNDGTGIGLSTVKALIDKSGGSIRVESEVGAGTTFVFRLKK